MQYRLLKFSYFNYIEYGLVIIKLNMLYLIYYSYIIMLKRYYLFIFVIIINIM